ncbi:MAG: NAD(P)-dependent alcohol dehydrogenase [Sphaerochaetaceae bacterium]|nr:NAD(P)-dependent alcohol dehydrogenase [Sphaerochaetaceae bacterium]MDC7248007.1 NAD(P)-dependent alcohol dehydrogenase [Sphaerochaetaceae bacterium]
MKALVLESVNTLNLRDFPIEESVGAYDVKIEIKACGICGSDVHYYKEGAIGDFVVNEPMILGHEAAGKVIEIGKKVTDLKVGDYVCMEPGVPNMQSHEVLEGNYHLDKDISFWATPPVHGVMRETVVHPARFCFKLPEGMTFAEGAMMEPLATGIEAAKKARIAPGDVALVTGSGTIGSVIALSALAGGCSKVYVSDVKQEKLDIIGSYDNIIAVNSSKVDLVDFIMKETEGRGADVSFEASGSTKVFPDILSCTRRGGTIVLVGMSNDPVPLNVPLLQVRGLSIETLFRYTNTFDRAVRYIESGAINIKPLISKTFSFEDSIKAYEYAAAGHPDVIKVMIEM